MAQVTLQLLRALATKADPKVLNEALVKSLNRWTVQYAITSPLRLAHFLAQSAHETDGFKTLVEYASGKRYEGRKDLGNTQPGDGVKYKGRGIFQLTGRSNYAFYGKLTGDDLVSFPDLAAHPDVAVQIACVYWSRKGLNAWADKDDLKQITRRINGGFNGLADRSNYLVRAKKLLNVGKDQGIMIDDPEEPAMPEAPSVPISPAEAPWYKSLDIGSLVMAGVSAFGSAATGASGPFAFALAFAVIIFTLVGAYFLIKRLKGR